MIQRFLSFMGFRSNTSINITASDLEEARVLLLSSEKQREYYTAIVAAMKSRIARLERGGT